MMLLTRDADFRRLGMACAVAAVIHALLIFGVTFVAPAFHPESMMEVTLALHKSVEKNPHADFLATHDQQGSGQIRKALETTSPDSADFVDSRINEVHPQEQHAFTPPPTPAEHRLIVTHRLSTLRTPPVERKLRTPPELAGDGALEMSAQTATIASLEARLAEKRQDLAKLTRVHTVSTLSARADFTAGYIDGFRQKVERFGNRNYPLLARQRHLQGEVRLLVAILPSGEVSQIRTLASSGQMVLDDAARRSVKLSSPFQPFTREMRQKMDVLQVIRTWRFAERMHNES